MALVWAHQEKIVLVKRSARSRTEIHVVAALWNHANECFTLSSRMAVPVAADAELLTGGSVFDSETGLLRSYLVLGKAESIYICGLDFDHERPDLLAKLSLPSSSSSCTTSQISNCCIQDCWLVDGPIVVAVWKGELLLVTSEASHRATDFYEDTEEVLHSEVVNTRWEANVLSLPESSGQQELKIHFCGDVRINESQEVILSLTASSGKRLRTGSSSPERYLQSWSFHSLSFNTNGPTISDQSSHGKEFKLSMSKQIPTELDPKLITCIHPLPFEPSATGDCSNYIFIGTKDRRLLRCRHAQVVKVLHFEAIPSQLHFGVVAGGQGVLLVVLDGSEQKVVAVCPESLEILQDWSKAWRVVVGDFTSSGHDQIILLQTGSRISSEEGLCTSVAQLDLNFTVVHGFSTVTCEGIQQGSQQHLAETKAINDCKVSGMETICKALQARVEAGLEQQEIAKNERDSKGELVRISSCLMQNLISRWALEESTNTSVEGDCGSKTLKFRQDRLELVRATKVWNRVYGLNWFFMVEIEATVEVKTHLRDGVLHNVSLVLTSLNSLIGGKSSVLKTISLGDRRAILVTCIPYYEFSLRPGLPFDVSISALVFQSGDTIPMSEISDISSRASGDVYTQWLGGSEVIYPTLTQVLEPKEACTVLEQGEQVQFVTLAKSEEHLAQLSGYMRSTLCMEEIPVDEEDPKTTVRWFNLCSVDGNGPYTANLCYLGLHAVIKLRAMSTDLLAILEQTSVELFTHHQFEIVSRIIPHEALEKMDDFVKALSKHLALQDSLMGKSHDKNSEEGRYVAKKLDKAVDVKFSNIWPSLL